jgi:acyl-CoA thioester hydrolase
VSHSLSGELHDGYHTLLQRVYFEHTDFSGIVYHARYLNFLERGRTDYVRLLGVHHNQLADGEHGEGLAFAVHRMEIDFKAAARIDDVLEITTRRGILKGPRLTFDQSIKRQETLILKARVTVVLINQQGRPRRFPRPVVEALGINNTG